MDAITAAEVEADARGSPDAIITITLAVLGFVGTIFGAIVGTISGVWWGSHSPGPAPMRARTSPCTPCTTAPGRTAPCTAQATQPLLSSRRALRTNPEIESGYSER